MKKVNFNVATYWEGIWDLQFIFTPRFTDQKGEKESYCKNLLKPFQPSVAFHVLHMKCCISLQCCISFHLICTANQMTSF